MSIFKAIRNGNIEKVKEYINSGENINIKDKYGETLLHIAIYYELPKMAKLLIENDADLGVQDRDGDIPLHFAIAYGQFEIAKLLIENGTNLNIKDKNGNTFLHLAIKYNKIKITELLLDYIDKFENKDTLLDLIKDNMKRGNAARWNKIFNIINGTKYGRGRK